MNTTYFKNLVAGNIFKTQTSPAIPTTYYLGLSTTLPDATGGNVSEPASSKGYARVNITSVLGAPADGVVSNTDKITFEEASDAWGTISYYVLYDAATGGNLLKYGTLTKTMTVSANATVWFDIGSITFSVLDKT